MCGRYQFSADEYKEIRQIVRDAQRRSEGNELNFPMAGDICPSQVAPVLVSRGEKIVGEFQQWGLPGFLGRQQIINARAETALDKKTFRESLLSRRCVIPSTGFFEWTKTGAKKKYLFRETGKSLLYMAGIYNDYGNERRYVILTTDANQSVQEIHIRMPVIVHQQEIGDWIKKDAAMQKILARVPPALTAVQA